MTADLRQLFVLVRLTAFILFCIGVQILRNGVSALIGTLPVAAVK